ncbi:uncharacterized protein GLRG_02144 [Colletotrichum graminicola M1.001]|uniref:Uncharacterized protein n=1 Tax=Colletotrichum graminicola (strain M1.001 / M2 / FGSC 10212) TaxID=645133 RepID=E3Q7W1_COLGM|nr:uncharacterized protein GLRG_02144 [Colletotrichum graminicola M1.001]EFQ26973.1 hypothetical protein GLRG_02144 [Colletotrichum graminicola M1.001]
MDKTTLDTQRYASEGIRLLYLHFSPKMFEKVKRTADDYKWTMMPMELIDMVHRHAFEESRDVFDKPVFSIDDFISAITPIFRPSVLTKIRSNLASFDAVAGVECTEVFLGQQTICDWIMHIIAEFLKPLHALEPGQFTSASRGTSSSATTSESLKKDPLNITQLDGPSDMFDVPTDRTVQQVILRGRTVLEAWANNETTRQLSMMRKGQERLRHDPENLDPTWSPRHAGSNPVYHGSVIRDEEWPRRFNETPFDALSPRTNSNQMVTDAFSVIFTAFSPLRAFLWAAFQNGLPRMAPDTQDILNTHNTWVSGGRTYQGAVLFKFHSTQPSPAGLTHYVIPEGKENDWGTKSLHGNYKAINERRVWDYYRTIHGQSGDVFPDLVHGLEYGHQLTALTPFRTNMWRTIWRAGAASNHLNAQHAATYAISFEIGCPAEPPPAAAKTMGKPGDGQDKDQGKGGGKGEGKASLGRRIRNKASTIFRPFSDRSS